MADGGRKIVVSERESGTEFLTAAHSEPTSGIRPEVLLVPSGSDVEVALLGPDGRIVCVNDAWTRFCDENGGDADTCGVGASYLGVCDGAAGDVMATLVGGAVRSALRGELPAPLAVEVPCHSSGTLRWFDVLVSSRLGDDGDCLGATVTLSLARSEARLSGAPRVAGGRTTGGAACQESERTTEWLGSHPSSERFGDGVAHAVFAVAPCGILLADDDGRIVAANRQADDLFGATAGGLVGKLLNRLLPSRWRDGPGSTPTTSEGTWADPAYSGRIAVGVRPDGTRVRVHLASAPVPLSSGTGTLVTASPVRGESNRSVPAALLVELDAAMRRIFAAGLSLASVRERLDQDGVAARVIGDVMADLDRAAREVRQAGLRRSSTGAGAPRV